MPPHPQARLRDSRLKCFAIEAIGNLRELAVALFFLGEGLGQQVGCLTFPEQLGPRAGTPVSGDLVVLDVLSRRDQGRITDVRLSVPVTGQLQAVIEQAAHAGGLNLARTGPQLGEDAIQPIQVLTRLLMVPTQGLAQRRRRGRLFQLWQHLENAALAAVQFVQLFDEQVAQSPACHD